MKGRLADADVYLNQAGITCSLGSGLVPVSDKLFDISALSDSIRCSKAWAGGRMPVGEVREQLLPISLPEEDTRNNRILTTAMTPLLSEIDVLKGTFGAERIAVVIGTSTSGISDGETALSYAKQCGQFPEGYHYRKQELYSPVRYLVNWLGLKGPAFTVSSACSSGAKSLACAARLLRLGVCDAVIAGAVDSLCEMTLQGFSSLSVTSSNRCNPFSINRDGINIGEGAGVFIVSRQPAPVRLAGVGETSDAHHISAPHPDGRGAEQAMRAALKQSGLVPGDVDYLNFHGTATDQNDKMEALAAHRVFGSSIVCGSTKGLTGHALAAAGALEAIFCWLTLLREDGKLPVHLWDGEVDDSFPLLMSLAASVADNPPKIAMSNSFAFGGNNISILLARD